jgi:hypothetical protein
MIDCCLLLKVKKKKKLIDWVLRFDDSSLNIEKSIFLIFSIMNIVRYASVWINSRKQIAFYLVFFFFSLVFPSLQFVVFCLVYECKQAREHETLLLLRRSRFSYTHTRRKCHNVCMYGSFYSHHNQSEVSLKRKGVRTSKKERGRTAEPLISFPLFFHSLAE